MSEEVIQKVNVTGFLISQTVFVVIGSFSVMFLSLFQNAFYMSLDNVFSC